MSEDPMVSEFFEELNDKFYPQIMEGIEEMDAGQVKEGIEALARPLHTIKGVTGFMPGFEPASSFTHKVESFLKKLTADEIESNEDNISAAAQAVHMVFQVLENLRETGAMDEGETEPLLTRLDELSGAGAGAGTGEALGLEFDVEKECDTTVLTIHTPRVHLAGQRAILVQELEKIEAGSKVLLDLSGVLTFGSASWEALEQFAGRLSISVSGLTKEAKETFYAWGFDEHIAQAANNRPEAA
jgi:chemotaxis protein histidine kinase CheA